MNIYDIANVQPCITSLSITGRNNGNYLHRWIIGDYARATITRFVRRDIQLGNTSLHDLNINWHHTVKGNDQPEMSWGFNPAGIPEELLNAEITHLMMRCHDGVSWWIEVDVEMSPLTAEMIITTFKEETDGGRN